MLRVNTKFYGRTRGTNSINLNGFYLSDNENDLTKWSFPNISIPANSYLIVWCDTAGNTQSGLHTTYRLSADQEEVYLYLCKELLKFLKCVYGVHAK